MSKEKWLLLLAAGALLMVIALPFPKQGEEPPSAQGTGGGAAPLWQGDTQGRSEAAGWQEDAGAKAETDSSGEEDTEAAALAVSSYEARLEERVRGLLQNVEGVGKVDVMVVLANSGERVLRVDRSASSDRSEEVDAAGGRRDTASSQSSESTVLAGSGGTEPVVEKELRPQIAGVVISAEGGGSPVVQAEISAAMEALFNLPAHKIKVLKRVER